VGAESGWGVTKAGHNYLNIGPGRTYQTTDQAAAAVVRLITASPYYSGVRAAIPAGPVAQVEAIQESPWDAGHYGGHRLMDIYRQLTGADTGPEVQPAGLSIPNPFDWAASAAGRIVSGGVELFVKGLLTIVFVGTGFALIGLGLIRLTGRDPKQVASQIAAGAGLMASAA
jgi:hypothetical protein